MKTFLVVIVILLSQVGVALADDAEDCRRGADGSLDKTVGLQACDRVLNSRRSDRLVLGTALINRGQIHYMLQDYPRAIDDLSGAIALKPQYLTIAYRNRGNCHFMLKDDDKAIADYTEAVRLDAGHASAYAARGLIYLRRNEIESAAADFRAALAGHNEYSDSQWAKTTARRELDAMGSRSGGTTGSGR